MEELETITRFLGYIGAIVAALASLYRLWKEMQTIREGVKCLLRSEILHIYHKSKDNRALRQYEAENFCMLYKAYKALGGNSFVDEIYEQTTEWRVNT